MSYELNEGSEKHVRKIVRSARKAEAVYLATDLDREGEAISWHIFEILREEGITEKIPFYRVEFSEKSLGVKGSVDFWPDASGKGHDLTRDGDNRTGYLRDEVLSRQPERVQTFLLHTSLLDPMSGPLCDAVTGQGDGQQANPSP